MQCPRHIIRRGVFGVLFFKRLFKIFNESTYMHLEKGLEGTPTVRSRCLGEAGSQTRGPIPVHVNLHHSGKEGPFLTGSSTSKLPRLQFQTVLVRSRSPRPAHTQEEGNKAPTSLTMVFNKIKISPNTDKFLQAKKKYLVKMSMEKIRELLSLF